ncbi:DUF4192 domain-containing protein [Corynebacterium macginleyi]|uniref:DUF4192 domain-containing protein n=1 Tax=Corynebacterium macginleyi TaxID=38290 RepID=A0A3M0H3Q8_9CORY|nr:DUF4192 domain-containing protein [Corynebacterium macginleyi]RMB64366.1 DUF4192 domain-containing protein [Corynebacterium macginleyi]
MKITTPQQPIRTPGDILANIPGILGFFPAESIVLISIEPTPTGRSMGPVARFDLSDVPAALPEIMNAFHCGSPEAILCFIISQRAEVELWEVIESLYHFEDDQGTGIDACWLVEEIATSTAYDLVFGCSTENGEGPMPAWTEGIIPAISTSSSMRACVENGTLPELSRDELVQQFAPHNPYFGQDEIASMQRCAEELSRQMRAGHGYGITDPIRVVQRLIADVQYVLSEVETLEENLENEELLCAAAMWMSTTWMRDLVIRNLVESSHAAGTLLLATARTFGGIIRSNALALYAATQVAQRFGVYAGPALTVAIDEAPRHNLSQLIAQAYRSGMGERLIASLIRGCDAAREAAGIAGGGIA